MHDRRRNGAGDSSRYLGCTWAAGEFTLFYGASPEAARHKRMVRRLRIALLASSALCAAALPAAAQEATWLLAPGSGDFNTAANWDPPPVPTDIAHFAASSITALSFSANTTIGTWIFNAGSPAYTFSTNGHTLEFTGVGINGDPTITIVGALQFSNTSTCRQRRHHQQLQHVKFRRHQHGRQRQHYQQPRHNLPATPARPAAPPSPTNSFLYFVNTSTAGNATITNNGVPGISATPAPPGSATIANNGGQTPLSFQHHRHGRQRQHHQ